MGGLQDIMRAKILSCYVSSDQIEKAINADNDIQKSGEGTRGGKIIGHTKSGKPIYDSGNHESHKNFTVADHNDAIAAHSKVRDDFYKKRNYTDKDQEDNDHAFDQQKQHIGYKNGILMKEEREDNETAEDHEDKADWHFLQMRSLTNLENQDHYPDKEKLTDAINLHKEQYRYHKNKSYDVKKSEEENIEKGRKSADFGKISKDGKYVRTIQGWKHIEVHAANVEKNLKGSASFGSLAGLPIEKLTQFNKLIKVASQKNTEGKILDKDEQYALDNSADIKSAIQKYNK